MMAAGDNVPRGFLVEPALPPAIDPEILDATGYRCPMPVVLMEKALRRLPPGGRLRVIADDPVATVDIPHFARAAGHVAVRETGAPGTCVFLVTAGGKPRSDGA